MAKKKTNAATAQLQTDETGEFRVIPLEYLGAEDLTLMFTDNIVVMHTEEHFVVDFYQNQQPLVLRPEDVLNVESVRSKCVGRFVMTPGQMRKFVVALNTNIERYDKQRELREEGGEE